MWSKVCFAVFSYYAVLVKCQFYECHDDSEISPPDGTLPDKHFTWLGVLQYIHIKLGHPHYFRVPRVVLISRQFALSTAADAAQVPKEYALGNIAFGNYERDEDECKLTIHDLEEGVECEAGALLMPIADVLLHPEYKHFGVKNSIALLKLITFVKSVYMLPVCLPFKNFLMDEFGRQTRERIIYVDFSADVPRDFAEEEKEVTRISLLPKEICHVYEFPMRSRRKNETLRDRLVCSTGCGFHSGAPTLVHEHTGHWSLVAVATGGPPCPDPLRSRRPPPTPHHIAIHPYVPWITAAITGKAIGAFAKDDPFGFIMPRAAGAYDLIAHQWLGHWWMGGLRCFDRGEAAEDLYKFYHEVFSLKPITETFLTYNIEISAPTHAKIICVKVGMPYRYGEPKVWDLDSPIVKVRIPFIRFKSHYKFQIEGWGYNSTETSESSEISDDMEDLDYKLGGKAVAGPKGEKPMNKDDKATPESADTANTANMANMADMANMANMASMGNNADAANMANMANMASMGNNADAANMANMANMASMGNNADAANMANMANMANDPNTAKMIQMANMANSNAANIAAAASVANSVANVANIVG